MTIIVPEPRYPQGVPQPSTDRSPLLALKIVHETYPIYAAVVDSYPEFFLTKYELRKVNNTFLVQDHTVFGSWGYYDEIDFRRLFRWSDKASLTSFMPIERIPLF